MDIDNLKISIIGLGYVGYPLFKLFSKRFDCIGIDKNVKVIQSLQQKESEQRIIVKIDTQQTIQILLTAIST